MIYVKHHAYWIIRMDQFLNLCLNDFRDKLSEDGVGEMGQKMSR